MRTMRPPRTKLFNRSKARFNFVIFSYLVKAPPIMQAKCSHTMGNTMAFGRRGTRAARLENK
jgi:hypothetical protein